MLCAGLGCSTIRSVRDEAGAPPRLSPPEAARARAEGRQLWEQQPRTVPRVTRAAQLLERAARTADADFAALIEAARALAFVAEYETRPAIRREAAQRGIVLSREARHRQPARVEGHYWYAVTVGLFADVERSYGLDAVGEMQTALQRAIELEATYDWAGPLRVLGILQLRTPGPPVSIGSTRKGLRLLEQAVAHFPDYPENYLYLAEALRDSGQTAAAHAAAEKVLQASPWPDRQFESQQWRAAAGQLD